MEAGGTLGLPRCPNTGDSLPAEPVVDPDCEDRAPGATRWLAMDPHTPFAITAGPGISTAGQHCCAPWARPGDRYRSVDRWGQVVGHVEVSGGEGYDVTRCFELSLRLVAGRDGMGIYASEGGSFVPPRSAEWQPTPDQIAALRPFIEAVEDMITDPGLATPQGARPAPPVGDRTMFFQVTTEREDGRGIRVDRYAVVGGRVLIIAWLSQSGRWVMTHAESGLTNFELAPNDAYRPIAVFDMNGDGVAEVLYHWNEGPSWGQVVLERDQPACPWSQVAESVGGATL